ncbi:MAG: hypothetical protein PHI59_09070, partial [Candidatus Omnitrophica bacterium]|nr:hypothetical protein [Candidatus Omnitrophota bacterium]
YDRAKAFSSFFPGIAGLHGIPLWAFYVNRGQCISSFGTKDKDGAILEFLPANQAYNLTAVRGFRTFIKIKKGTLSMFYEPFKGSVDKLSKGIDTKMSISPSRLEIEETNDLLGLKIKVSYITVPGEPFAALARKLSVTNISDNKASIELIDGLPQIIPFGMTEWHAKHMSRTIEAWMHVLNLDNNAPFYKLKVNPQDRPELEYIEGGNFYLAYIIDGTRAELLKDIIDPDIIFGRDGDISYPRLFVEGMRFGVPKEQKSEGKTPSAFCHAQFNITAGGNKDIVSIIGHVKDIKGLGRLLPKVSKADYFPEKLSENKEIINRLVNTVFTKSSSDQFDFYSKHTFLDNLLRGGFPVNIDTEKGKFVFYTYARKHGDLERDYNAFLLQPSYYSQGNGAYRDINQNRRNDTLFNPHVADANILTFLNAIQPDGFNPHLVEGVILFITDKKALEALLRHYIENTPDKNKMKSFLSDEFTPGSLAAFIEKEKVTVKKSSNKFVESILGISTKEDVVKPGEGYWVDHWTYNTDLFENYLAVYPERLKNLLLERKMTFYDTYLKVNPRKEKYVYVDGKIRQFGSVAEDKEKKYFIAERKYEPHKVRIKHGKGGIYKTSLLAKLLCVVANKMASLDPFGIGIEMEAGKPGWCDSLNNLPGIFGSSLCETFELKRIMLFIKSSLRKLDVGGDYNILLPAELADFILDLHKLAGKNLSTGSRAADFDYWDSSSAKKEQYRHEVWYGFDGRERLLSIDQIDVILDTFLHKIESGLKKGFSKKDRLTYTYYINEVEKFVFIKENGKTRVNAAGLPNIKALSFSHKPISLFLEGPMHAMRVTDKTKEIKSLYQAVKKSELFDTKLKMYKINAPLKGMPNEIGRSTIFTPGWLENESIWLHMEYKYLLEVLRKGLHKEFFSDLKNCLIAFQDPCRYGRSILENSSFLVSSAHPDRNLAGNGFVARLTGSTTEFLTMWLILCAGERPFKISEKGELYLEFNPTLPRWLFSKEENSATFYFSGGTKEEVRLPKDSFAFCFLGGTLVVYHNPKRRDTFGNGSVKPVSITLKRKNKEEVRLKSGIIPAPIALKVRSGFYDRIDVVLT